MKATEAAALLTIAAAYDNRKPDADTAKAWAMALDGLRFEDCRAVVVEHYRDSREWMMPVDVIKRVKRIRRERVDRHLANAIPPSGLSDAEYDDWYRRTVKAIADGDYQPEPPSAIDTAAREREIFALGKAQSVDAATAVRPVREAHEQARRELQEAAAEEKRAEDERRAKREEARAALASARANQQAEQPKETTQ